MKQSSVLGPTRTCFNISNNHLEYHLFLNPSQISPPHPVVFQSILQSPVHKHTQEEAKNVLLECSSCHNDICLTLKSPIFIYYYMGYNPSVRARNCAHISYHITSHIIWHLLAECFLLCFWSRTLTITWLPVGAICFLLCFGPYALDFALGHVPLSSRD